MLVRKRSQLARCVGDGFPAARVPVLARGRPPAPPTRSAAAGRPRPCRRQCDARRRRRGIGRGAGPRGLTRGRGAAGEGARGARQLVQRRRTGGAVRAARHRGAAAASPGGRRAGDRDGALPREPDPRRAAQPRGRGRPRRLGAPAVRPPPARVPPRAVRGARHTPRAGPDPECAGPAPRARRPGRPAHGCAVRRRGPGRGPRPVLVRADDQPLPPARAAAAAARERCRRPRQLAASPRHLSQLRLGGAARARFGALLVGRRPGDADRAGANSVPVLELRLRAERADRRAEGRRGRCAPRGPTAAAPRRRGGGAVARVRGAGGRALAPGRRGGTEPASSRGSQPLAGGPAPDCRVGCRGGDRDAAGLGGGRCGRGCDREP